MEASFCAGWCGEAYLNQNKSKHINFRSSKISLAVRSRQVDYEQHHDQRKDGSEAQIIFVPIVMLFSRSLLPRFWAAGRTAISG